MKDIPKDNYIKSVYGMNKAADKNNNKKVLYGMIFFSILTFLIISVLISAKNASNEKNLVGYTMESEKLVDNCKLVNVEGTYIGKGTLDGNVHYIFQVEKDGKLSDNKDVTDKEIELNYITVNDTSNPKFGTVDAYIRTYVKKAKDGTVNKRVFRYFYKAYIPSGSIKDCGKLTTDSEDD